MCSSTFKNNTDDVDDDDDDNNNNNDDDDGGSGCERWNHSWSDLVKCKKLTKHLMCVIVNVIINQYSLTTYKFYF